MKKSLIKIILGLLFLAIGLASHNNFYISFSAFLLGYFVLGIEVIINACKNIFKGNFFNENFLMAIATIGAFILGQYPEGVAVMLFYQIGELFNDFATHRSKRSIEELIDVRPDYANLLMNGRPEKVSPQKIKTGDLIIVKPGERFPIDVIIKEGVSTVDTSSLTGESIPMEVKSGVTILSGCINLTGTVIAQAKTTYNQSTVSRILELVKNSKDKKAQTETFIKQFSKYYTPIIILAALIIAIIPPILISNTGFETWIYRALIFLVISCPCALLISIPLSFFCGIGSASKKGILIKGGRYIEALSTVKNITFDKTGTLTEGKFSISAVHPINMDRDTFLRFAAHAEIHSSHPIAISIKNSYDKNLDENKVKDTQNLAGYGIKTTVDSRIVYLGNKRFMDKHGIPCHDISSDGSIIHMCIDGKYAGYVIISDKIKPDSVSTIKKLYDIGIEKIAMLTGDAKNIASSVARDLGLDYFASELLPEDKVNELKKLINTSNNKGAFAFVGDGINDAPTLATADIGIAMGAFGSDAAVETADVVIMDDKPSKVVEAVLTSQFTMKIAKQNISLSLGIKFAILLLGVLGLSSMWVAVFADVGVSILVILNSTRIMKH